MPKEPCVALSMEFIFALHRYLQGMDSIFVVAYVDEILTDSRTCAYHLHHFNQVLSILRNVKLYANLWNYEFCVENGTFLCYV